MCFLSSIDTLARADVIGWLSEKPSTVTWGGSFISLRFRNLSIIYLFDPSIALPDFPLPLLPCNLVRVVLLTRAAGLSTDGYIFLFRLLKAN